MSTQTRVQRWREAKRQEGKKAITVWLTTEEEMRLKDLALQWHCSPSALMQQALAQFSPRPTQDISNGHDTLLIQRLIREELARIQGALLPVTDTVMDTVTVTTPETPARETSITPTPTMAHITDTCNGDVSDTRALPEAETPAIQEDGTDTAPAARPRLGVPKLTPRQIRALRDKRQRGVPVPALMEEYGISRASVFRYLQSEKR